MASSAGNPNQPPPFDVQKLFKPPPPSTSNPTPNLGTAPFPLPSTFPALPTLPTPPPPSFYPPQSSAPILHQHQLHHHRPFLHYPPDPLARPLSPYPPQALTFPPPSAPNAPPGPNHGAHLMALLGGNAAAGVGPMPTSLESAVSMPPPSLHSGSSGEYSGAGMVPILPTAPSAPPAVMASAPMRTPSSKLPKGRRLSTGDRAVYDVDVRLAGESQPPQLEVTPITKYVSDPGLVLGRQIAVNRSYICYGLKLGAIRVLNINTALRSLLRGHYQRVSDMVFFAEDVHLLASASVDGRIFVWKIDEGPDESDKPQITGKIVIALQIVSQEESLHPRVCWHSHKQEVLVIGIGSIVLKIDTTKVGKGESFSADEPLKCPVEKLVDGVQFVGKHDAHVTDLSMSQWMTTRLVSASKDGTIKIWEDRKAVPLVTLKPHDGHPVDSVAFLKAPHRPDHIVLVTSGPLNREVKIWTSTNQEGWLLPSDSESWVCTQTLELRNSAEPRVEDAFFNQVVVLPQASLILLANAQKNAIYAVHIDYGPNPASTRMDYISEFTVTMPILSLTGTSECLSDTEQVVQVYCVQTQAIQQYALDLSQCLPPPLDSGGLENDSSLFHVSQTAIADGLPSEYGQTIPLNDFLAGSPLLKSNLHVSSSESTTAPRHTAFSNAMEELATSTTESKTLTPLSSSNADVDNLLSPSVLSPDVAGRYPDFRSSSKDSEHGPSFNDHAFNLIAADQSNERKVQGADSIHAVVNFAKEDARCGSNDIAVVQNSTGLFKAPNNVMHLVTPSEIKSGIVMSYESPSFRQEENEKAVRDVEANKDIENIEVEVKVVGESGARYSGSESQKDMKVLMSEKKEILLNSETVESNIETTKDYSTLTAGVFNVEDTRLAEDIGVVDSGEQGPNAGEDVQEISRDVPENSADAAKVRNFVQSPTEKGKKQKESQPSGPSSSFASPFNSTDSLSVQESGQAVLSAESTSSQFLTMQETLNEVLQQKVQYNEIISILKEMQKHLSVCASIPKETRRLEASLGRNMEKSNKANADAITARFQEDNSKLEKNIMQQISNLMTTSISKELSSMFEKTLKKELATVGQAVARAITPVIEKSLSPAIAESFQSVSTKLDKTVCTKLEATVARQIQAQFQTSGKQALQETLRSTVESLVVPAFEQSCKAMFEQVDATFQKGMSEYTGAFQKQFESSHTPLALSLKDAISSITSITQSFNTELAEGLQKLLSLAASSNQSNSMTSQQINDPLGGLQRIETPLDPTKELTRLISDRKFDEAFTMALQRSDVSLVSWLCSQVDLQAICSLTPLPLSQRALLVLIQQLAWDINNETSKKVGWMTEVAGVINPTDPAIAPHVRPIFEQIYQILMHQRSLHTTTPAESSSIRLVLHVINSVLLSCK